MFLTDAPKSRLCALSGKPHHTAVPGQHSVSTKHGATLGAWYVPLSAPAAVSLYDFENGDFPHKPAPQLNVAALAVPCSVSKFTFHDRRHFLPKRLERALSRSDNVAKAVLAQQPASPDQLPR